MYEGNKLSVEELKQWLSEKCVPLVREITFENGEVNTVMRVELQCSKILCGILRN